MFLKLDNLFLGYSNFIDDVTTDQSKVDYEKKLLVYNGNLRVHSCMKTLFLRQILQATWIEGIEGIEDSKIHKISKLNLAPYL